MEGERQLLRRAREAAGSLDIWRAVNMREADFAALSGQPFSEVEALVLDSGNGGTGTRFNWSTIPTEIKSKSFLAGGLHIGNLDEALSVATAGLDLNSGLEYAPGRKDSALISQAFSAIRNYTHS